MSKTNTKIKYRCASVVAAFCILTATWTAAAAPKTSSQPPPANSGSIGEVRLEKYVTLRFEPPPQPGVTRVTLAGPNLSISSPRYRMVAPRISLTFKNGRVTTGSATGGVQVTVKDEGASQTTQVTCDTAIYTGGTSANRGRIDLKGTVRSKTYSPGFAQPLVSESESGFIVFNGNGTPEVQLNNGSASVTLVEPTPAPTKK